MLLSEVTADRIGEGHGARVRLMGNFTPLQQYAHDRTAVDSLVRAELGAAEIAGPAASPGFVPDAHHLPWLYEAQYLRAVHKLGSPAFTPRQILSQSESDREVAGSVLLKAERFPLEQPAPQELSGAVPAAIARLRGMVVSRPRIAGTSAGCRRLTPHSARASAMIVVAPGRRLYLTVADAGHVAIYVRRLARHVEPQPLYLLSTPSSTLLSFPRDASTMPWHVRVVPTTPVAVCLV